MAAELDRAIEDYLAYLRVERGLADATLRAYRADLSDFAMSRGAAARWTAGPETAQRYLAARARRGRPGDPGLAPTSLRRRAAAIRGFYRFAFGDGIIGLDVAAHLDLPRQPRLLPETLTVDEVVRLLDAAGGEVEAAPTGDPGAGPSGADGSAVRNRALLELLYAAGLRVSEALGLDLDHLSLDSAWVRVVGKGDRERMVPVGDVALGLAGALPRLAAGRLDRGVGGARRRSRPAVRHRPRAPARAPAGLGGRQGLRRRGRAG